MTLPGPDARVPRSVPRRPQIVPPSHSISVPPPTSPDDVALPPIPSPLLAVHGYANKDKHEHAIDFATHSWDLATGGLKTMTAKRELPMRHGRRAADGELDASAPSHSYVFVLVIMVCVVLMLLGGCIVLLVMLQT